MPLSSWAAPRCRRFRQPRLPAVLAICLFAGGLSVLAQSAASASDDRIGIAVFAFELRDMSAGSGIIPLDANDADHLANSTDEVRSLLAGSGDYFVVETADAASEIVAAGGVQNCRGCEAAVAARLGADQSLAGVITRVNRTEYTIQIVIRDSTTNEAVANHFTGLRMGANYAWSRGARSLVSRQMLAKE